MWSKKVVKAVLAASFVVLAGCSRGPDNDVLMKDAQAIAGTDAVSASAFKVDGLHKYKTWEEGGVHKVIFRYNLVLNQDYPEVVIAIIDHSVNAIKTMPPEELNVWADRVGFADLIANLSAGLPTVTQALQAYQKDPRISAYLLGNMDLQTNPLLMAMSIYAADATLKEFPIADGASAGTRIERQAVVSYRKTDAGWERIEDGAHGVRTMPRGQATAPIQDVLSAADDTATQKAAPDLLADPNPPAPAL